LFSGCSKSPGWIKDYIGKTYTLEGSTDYPFIEKAKIIYKLTNVRFEREFTIIEFTGEVLSYQSSFFKGYGTPDRIFAYSKDKDEVKLKTEASINVPSKTGEKFKGDIWITSKDPENISEITFALFDNSVEKNMTEAFFTLKQKTK
jgi:hypothetical protein